MSIFKYIQLALLDARKTTEDHERLVEFAYQIQDEISKVEEKLESILPNFQYCLVYTSTASWRELHRIDNFESQEIEDCFDTNQKDFIKKQEYLQDNFPSKFKYCDTALRSANTNHLDVLVLENGRTCSYFFQSQADMILFSLIFPNDLIFSHKVEELEN